MQINRIWAMPNKNTFSITPIKALITRYINPSGVWLDPFARQSPFNVYPTLISNDLDLNQNTNFHLEALEFINRFPDNSVEGVLFDPPYSPRQISECYKAVGKAVHMKDTQSSFYGDRKNAVARVVKNGGIVISCGWNSGGIGVGNGFQIVEILLVPHGGAHNDTIVTVERKLQS